MHGIGELVDSRLLRCASPISRRSQRCLATVRSKSKFAKATLRTSEPGSESSSLADNPAAASPPSKSRCPSNQCNPRVTLLFFSSPPRDENRVQQSTDDNCVANRIITVLENSFFSSVLPFSFEASKSTTPQIPPSRSRIGAART